ncbi:MAG: hypothetical protein OXG34_16540 [bacterium]|nr:hypothetical protein [bacterium]
MPVARRTAGNSWLVFSGDVLVVFEIPSQTCETCFVLGLGWFGMADAGFSVSVPVWALVA